jgi:hypothetical protein
MEMVMVMETLMGKKLKKVGERVRLYSKVIEESYNAMLEEMVKKGHSTESRVGGPSVNVSEEID